MACTRKMRFLRKHAKLTRAPLAFAAWAMLLLIAGCAVPERNRQIASENFRSDYGYRSSVLPGENLPGHYIILTFSGGGTRAAALAQGVLREFEATRIRGGSDRRLIDEVDMISSVSGGSVTAANFALHGRGGLAGFEQNFLKRNVMGELIGGVVNPVNWPRFAFTDDSRISLLVDILDRRVFQERTFEDLQKAGGPFLILNAADMTTGQRFTFTQHQFDLLCSDLGPFRLSEAVAASAAYPVGLTPITLRNYSPCPPQRTGQGEFLVSRVRSDVGDELHTDPDVASDNVKRTPRDTLFVGGNSVDLTRRSAGLRENRLLDAAARKNYVHLLDGGIADNLGLGEPLELMSAAGQGGPAAGIRAKRIRQVVFVVVNARSDPATDRDASRSTPGIVSMAMTSIGAAIDGRTGGLQAQLNTLPQLQRAYEKDEDTPLKIRIVYVDFDLIRDAACRKAFADISTNWHLKGEVVDALMELGAALVRSSPEFQALVQEAGGSVRPDPAAGPPEWPGQLRAKRACARLQQAKPVGEPVQFGNAPP